MQNSQFGAHDHSPLSLAYCQHLPQPDLMRMAPFIWQLARMQVAERSEAGARGMQAIIPDFSRSFGK